MKVLKPHTSSENATKEVEYIIKDHIYVQVTDYNRKRILKEVIFSISKNTWHWIDLKEKVAIEFERNFKYSTFDQSINRSVNDMYCTVYEFENLDEMIQNWNNIKYIDSIGIIYQEKG